LKKLLPYIIIITIATGCVPTSRFDSRFSSGDIWLRGDEKVSLLMAGVLNPDNTVQPYSWTPEIRSNCAIDIMNLMDDEVTYQLKTNFLNDYSQLMDPIWQNKVSDLLGVTHIVYFSAEKLDLGGPTALFIGVLSHPNQTVTESELIKVRINMTIYDIKAQTVQMNYAIRTRLDPIPLLIGGDRYDTAINMGTVAGAVQSGMRKAFRDFKQSVTCNL